MKVDATLRLSEDLAASPRELIGLDVFATIFRQPVPPSLSLDASTSSLPPPSVLEDAAQALSLPLLLSSVELPASPTVVDDMPLNKDRADAEPFSHSAGKARVAQ